jgi:hypothetical protein
MSSNIIITLLNTPRLMVRLSLGIAFSPGQHYAFEGPGAKKRGGGVHIAIFWEAAFSRL